MTTKQKIIASIWVPVLTLYILSTIVFYFTSHLGQGDFWDYFEHVFEIFIMGSFVWVPLLIISVIIEYLSLGKEKIKTRIKQILMIEIIIFSIPWWFMIITIPEATLEAILTILVIALSIAARWGYLKWRKIF
jgi:hypothetical protein